MSWRPIDVAPRDGAKIVVAFRSLLTNEISVSVVAWVDGAWGYEQGDDVVHAVAGVAVAWIELPTTTPSGMRRDRQ